MLLFYMKKLSGLIFCCLLTQLLLAQITTANKLQSYHQLKTQLRAQSIETNFSEQIQQFTFQESRKNVFNLMQKEQQQMPAAYAYKDLAFFCKIEVKLEKAVKLPIKFRLGSVDYVDYLEGKRASY